MLFLKNRFSTNYLTDDQKLTIYISLRSYLKCRAFSVVTEFRHVPDLTNRKCQVYGIMPDFNF